MGGGVGVGKIYRLQLRLRIQPKRSTRADSNSGLDSDSAALQFSLSPSARPCPHFAVGALAGHHLVRRCQVRVGERAGAAVRPAAAAEVGQGEAAPRHRDLAGKLLLALSAAVPAGGQWGRRGGGARKGMAQELG